MHKIGNTTIGLLAIFLTARDLSAQPGNFIPVKDPVEFIGKVKKTNMETQTLESDFRQVRHLDILLEDIVSVGKFYYKRENNLRWEYTRPFYYSIVFTGSDIVIRDNERESHFDVESNQMFRQISRLMTHIVLGDLLENEKEFSGNYFENRQQYLAILTPLSEDYRQFFHQIEIYFDRTSYRVMKLKLSEQSGGDHTLIEFTNEKRNEALPDTIFFHR